jgi:putative flavoprotein involved in K+ transport
VLERGEVANSWRTERWDSLRLLTPNWQTRLPALRYEGPDPDGYMSTREVIDFISRYAAVSNAPVRTQTAVSSLRRVSAAVTGGPPEGGPYVGGPYEYRIATSDGEIRCRTVVIASGACNLPVVPALSQAIPSSIAQFTPFDYGSPSRLPDGGVLVVGPSATGVQLAAEIHRSGRQVTLAVGEHVRLPRMYRGRDVLWWMDKSGVWDQRYDEIDDITRARKLPSPQLVGTPEHATLDLNALMAMGVRLVGRLAAVRDGRALFSGGLRNLFALADLKMERLLDTFDAWASKDDSHEDTKTSAFATGYGGTGEGLEGLGSPERFEPTRVPDLSPLQIDLRSGEIRSIVWCTGFRPDYSWLHVPVLDEKGYLQHDGGVVTHSPGLYALGLPVLRRRKSTFIHGIEDDARDVIGALVDFLG